MFGKRYLYARPDKTERQVRGKKLWAHMLQALRAELSTNLCQLPSRASVKFGRNTDELLASEESIGMKKKLINLLIFRS